MNNSMFWSIFLLTSFASCKSDMQVTYNEVLKMDQKELIHCVYFDLKPDLAESSLDSFMNVLKGFSDIESTNEVIVGPMEDTGDPRMDLKYDVALQVMFDSKEKLAEYQIDSIHLSGKAIVGRYLSGPPVVFDYWNQ